MECYGNMVKLNKLYNATKNSVTPIDTTVADPTNLNDDQIIALSQYYAYLMNGLRQQVWRTKNLVVQEDSIQAIKAIVNAYETENKEWSTGHSETALDSGNKFAIWTSENMGRTSSSTTTMTTLYENIYDSVISTIRRDYPSNYGHVISMLGTSNSTTPVSVGYNISVSPNGVTRVHAVTFADNSPIINPPYDTTALKTELATAKTVQAQAIQADKQAQTTLASATTANNQAKSALQATKIQLTALKATADQTPAAQATLTSATTVRKAAEARLANAQQAVDNLNADVATKTKALEDAKSVQAKAVAADTSAKETLAQARTTNDKAHSALTATRATIASLEAIADQTPTAQATLTSATAARQAAETRLTNAQQAVDNLNADVATKTKALEDAKSQLATEEAKLAQLKEAKSTSEVVLAEAQSKVEALKAEEAKIADEIAVLKAQLAEQLAKLATLKNADQVLADAQAELAKAIEAHTAAKATLDAEIDKLDQLLKNQHDAKAQYEVVKEAYTQAQIVAQRQAINDAGGQPIAITDKVGKIVDYFDGNQTAGTKLQPITYSRVEKYRQLPQTGSQESLLVLLGYTALAGLGLGYAKKRRRG
ncbi:TPA: SEC10/PgrA surface exclusion domain-containing protein [Streptococcus suis]|nr:SEC10/PgrA surface exclusion domain-containing protein [Streptococcus suis]